MFLPIKAVGVQGDQRTHNYVLALRAVCSSDGMTADWYPFQPNFMRDVSNRICNKVRQHASYMHRTCLHTVDLEVVEGKGQADLLALSLCLCTHPQSNNIA